jgi:EAL domain-containing protein (putative c-di-GMP-specific phosphodiesterase class I)
VTFNVSPREFWQPELATRILRQVRNAGLSPTSLIVEITESAAMSDPQHTARVVDELRAGGLGLAIDGFGTGSSSLARLTQLRPEFLKIDRSFVVRTPGARADEAIVRAMVALAETLELSTVAVGVETEAQEAFLVAQGCTLAQGFRYSRPVPAEQLTEMLGATLV